MTLLHGYCRKAIAFISTLLSDFQFPLVVLNVKEVQQRLGLPWSLCVRHSIAIFEFSVFLIIKRVCPVVSPGHIHHSSFSCLSTGVSSPVLLHPLVDILSIENSCCSVDITTSKVKSDKKFTSNNNYLYDFP